MEDSVVINGTALSAVRYLAPEIGFSQPAGAIAPAGAERIEIANGKVYLDVSIATNAVFEVEKAGGGEWRQAEIEDVRKEPDGTGTLTVPATAEDCCGDSPL